MTRLALFATITPKPEYFDDALRAVQAVIPPTLAEPGCHRFELHRNLTAPGSFCLVELWEDPAALEFHHAQPYTKEVFDLYQTWLREPLVIVKMAPVA